MTVAARDSERAMAAVDGIRGVRVEQLDLTDPASVEAFAARWIASGRPLHMLVNNAAVLFSPELRLDARGNELAFSTSHLGHFQLTRALLPALRAGPAVRAVLTVTSGAARFGEIRWDDLDVRARLRPGGCLRRSPSGPTPCSPSSSTVDSPKRASGPSPRTPGSSSDPARTPRQRLASSAPRASSTRTAPRSSTRKPGRRPSSRAPPPWCSERPAHGSTASAGSTSKTVTSPCSTTKIDR